MQDDDLISEPAIAEPRINVTESFKEAPFATYLHCNQFHPCLLLLHNTSIFPVYSKRCTYLFRISYRGQIGAQ